ncbi:hypothetical protein AB0395_01325 [Streptosporangium sp. NPDC051023]|uniref:hypothetical protein n=1 Tax=Streptosporangium sp. NPDC051023 TaxID=3155410 RepID=UPI00344C3650
MGVGLGLGFAVAVTAELVLGVGVGSAFTVFTVFAVRALLAASLFLAVRTDAAVFTEAPAFTDVIVFTEDTDDTDVSPGLIGTAEEACAAGTACSAAGPITNAARARALTVTAVRTGLFLPPGLRFLLIVEELPFFRIFTNDVG